MKSTAGENLGLYIKNKQNFEILVFSHEEEFWLTFPRFPLNVGSTKIEARNNDQMVSADVKVMHTINYKTIFWKFWQLFEI